MTREDPAAFAPPPAFGPFRVLHQIGVGALGPVFRTYEPTRDRLIAVKVFRLDLTPEQAQALADELSKAADAGLFHPSIVEPVAAGLEGTVAYRAEEYVAAESLDVAIRHYAPAPLDRVLPFITQLAGAIDFARAAGIGHGALHLRDIFVTPEEARASGFGVVEALERMGLRAPIRRPYSAPERIAGQAWGTPADVFSLAAICYELLTARRPLGIGAEIGPVDEAEGGEHPAMVHAVLSRAMDEDPAARFPSALALASALEAAARGEHAGGAVDQVGAIAAAGIAATDSVRDARAAAPPDASDREQPDALDDIAVERDEDEVYYDLAEEERAVREAREAEGVEPASLFADDEEAVEDLALELPSERFTDLGDAEDEMAAGADTADEADAAERLYGAAAVSLLDERRGRGLTHGDDDDAAAGVQPVMPYADLEDSSGGPPLYEDEPAVPAYVGAGSDRDFGAPVSVAPARTSPLVIVAALLLGLVIFAAGYVLGGRSAPSEGAPAESGQAAMEPTPPGPTSTTAEVLPSDTEQPLAPPTAAPDVPDEVPPPDSPPAAAAATTGSLVVTSTPAKAGVTINGQWRGRTPLTLEEQPFGTYNIRVVQEGFAVATERVVLSASSPARTLSFRLERPARPVTPAPPAPAPPTQTPPRTTPPAAQQPTAFVGSIYVDSRPRGARVLLNGKPIGTTPMRIPELPIGSHVVRLELDSHQIWSTSARVQAGQETRVTGSLDPIR